jgi:hypothetical protein
MYLLGLQLPEAEDTRLEWGSQYGQRIFIPKRGLRISLRAFARSTAEEPMSGGDFDELNEGLRMEGGASLSLALLLCHLAVEHEMDPMGVLQEQQVGFFASLCQFCHIMLCIAQFYSHSLGEGFIQHIPFNVVM